MKRTLSHVLASAAAWLLIAVPSYAQEERQAQPAKSLTVQGKIVRMQGPDQVIVQTNDNKEATLYVDPQTRYTINGKQGTYQDLRVGTVINAGYLVRDNRHYANVVTVGAADTTIVDGTPAPIKGALQTSTLRGKVLQVTAPDRFVIQTADSKQVTVHAADMTRFMINGQAAKFTDLKVGLEVNVVLVQQETRMVAQLVTTEPVAATGNVKSEGTELTGTVVKVVGKDQVVIRTGDNKEITVYVQPETRYQYDNDQPAQFGDVYQGAKVQVQYVDQDRRPVARRIFGFRKR